MAWLAPIAAGAEVKTRVTAGGTIEIYNEGASPGLGGGGPLKLRPVPNADWELAIRHYAASQGLDARLVQAVIQAESAYNPRAVSRVGAMGLMQLMPATARLLAVAEPFSPEENIRGGVTYLRRMLDEFGSVELAVAAYNAGPGAVRKYNGVPPYAETRQYVRRVLGLYRGESSVLFAVSGGGGPSQRHALQQNAAPTLLQRALATGAVRSPAYGDRTSLTAAASAAPSPPRAVASAPSGTSAARPPQPAAADAASAAVPVGLPTAAPAAASITTIASGG
jgi:hypothetical protein